MAFVCCVYRKQRSKRVLHQLVLFHCLRPKLRQAFGKQLCTLSHLIGLWCVVFISFRESPQGSREWHSLAPHQRTTRVLTPLGHNVMGTADWLASFVTADCEETQWSSLNSRMNL